MKKNITLVLLFLFWMNGRFALSQPAFPPPTGVIGAPFALPSDVSPVELFALWDVCGPIITGDDLTTANLSCLSNYASNGHITMAYHPLNWVEAGIGGWSAIQGDYPNLEANGVWMDFDGNIILEGGIPHFSNASDDWLNFMTGVGQTQIIAGMQGIAFDAGWGSLGPGISIANSVDFSPAAVEGFRVYLQNRYSTSELLAKGVNNITNFNIHETLAAMEVYVDEVSPDDPGIHFTPSFWLTEIGRIPGTGETYTLETLDIAVFYQMDDPIIRMFWMNGTGDYGYYSRMRLREIYEDVNSALEASLPDWKIGANVYNDLRWDNSSIVANVVDLPMGELSYGEGSPWPTKTFSAFYKTISELEKRFSSMFWPGQVLFPNDDLDSNDDTPALVAFLADAYASGGISQHPGSSFNATVNPFYELIQAHENFFAETDNKVALYYSLGNHMGDVHYGSIMTDSFYGAARLLEDSHVSYDVLYQGSQDFGPGTVQWVDKDLTLGELQEYDVVILPETVHMTDTEVANLLSFVSAGGLLLVFGDAGTFDYSYPAVQDRNDPTWRGLVDNVGTWPYGAGAVIVYPVYGGQTIAANYHNNHETYDLADFQAEFFPQYDRDVITDLGQDVHIHRFSDPVGQLEVFHLVNLDYKGAVVGGLLENDYIEAVYNKSFQFMPRQTMSDPMLMYYTPENPAGTLLPVLSIASSGMIETSIPVLEVYGILSVVEGLGCASVTYASASETGEGSPSDPFAVRIIEALDQSGDSVPNSLGFCGHDNALGTRIPPTPINAIRKASIEFGSLVCHEQAPVVVEITAVTSGYAIIEGFDDHGNSVAFEFIPSIATEILIQKTLSSSSGIRTIEIETGSDFCLIRVCWDCVEGSDSEARDSDEASESASAAADASNEDPDSGSEAAEQPTDPSDTPPTSDDPAETNELPAEVQCMEPGDVFSEPVLDLPVVNLNALQIHEALMTNGHPAPLNVVDCNGDGRLDVQIPWSEASASRKAVLKIDPQACAGSAPQFMSFVLTHGTSLRMEAFDETGASVAMVSSTESDPNIPKTVTLSSSNGIQKIQIEGSEICIFKICGSCEDPTAGQ